MRAESCARRALVRGRIAVLTIAIVFGVAARSGADGTDSPPDVESVTAPAHGDSTLAVGLAARDSTRGVPVPAPDLSRIDPPSVVDFEEQRKRGDVSLELALRGRRPGLLLPLPYFGLPAGSFSVLDAGSRIRPSPMGTVAEVASDATPFAATSYGVGLFDLAVILDNPRDDGVETLDLTALRRGLEPESFTRAGELFAHPPAERAITRVMPGEGARQRRARSALYYGNGDRGVLETGARFTTPSMGKGFGASYAHHEADGISPLHHTRSSRYAFAAGLPRALAHAFWIEGRLYQANVEDQALGIVDVSTSAVGTVVGRAQLDSRDLTLHATAAGERWRSRWTIRAGSAERNRVEPDGSRVNWMFPEWSVRWAGSVERPGGWGALASVQSDSRRIEYRADASPAFASRREEARLGIGLRRSTRGGAGVQADVAGDWRETGAALLDARLCAWGQGGRLSARADLEWAHERPSSVDLLSPNRTLTALYLPDFTKTLHVTSSGDRSLSARRLAGLLARGSCAVSGALSVEAEGSIRRVDDDFGWDLTRLIAADTLFVESIAARRGDGFVSYGAIGFRIDPGLVHFRGIGWSRSGPDHLSPRSASPSRYGGDGTADVRVVLFGGDLSLELGFEIHAQGPRRGVIREPGSVTVDSALRADFGPAGAFLEFTNLLDRSAPSAVYDVVSDRAVSMPGRWFQFGVVWYLFD